MHLHTKKRKIKNIATRFFFSAKVKRSFYIIMSYKNSKHHGLFGKSKGVCDHICVVLYCTSIFSHLSLNVLSVTQTAQF